MPVRDETVAFEIHYFFYLLVTHSLIIITKNNVSEQSLSVLMPKK